MERFLPLSQLIELCDALETACDMSLENGHIAAPSSSPGSGPIVTGFTPSPSPTCVNKPATAATIPRTQLNALDSLSIVTWIQRRLNALGYNHLPGNPFFPINKRASARALGHVAASMFAAGLPIKCLEAVVLSMWLISEVLPAGISSVPIAFKSMINLPGCEPPGAAAGKQYRHIVLAVAHHSSGASVSGEAGEVWGALGLSRRKDLMNKPFQFKSLADLVDDYLLAYGNNGHEVVKVKIGLPAPKSMGISTSPIVWKHLILRISPLPPPTAASQAPPSADFSSAPMRTLTPPRASQLTVSQRQTLATFWREVRPTGSVSTVSTFPTPQSPARGGMLRGGS